MKLDKLTLIAATAALAATGFAWAQPSEYFLWKQRLGTKTVCDVAPPDASYTKVDGPFEDANCKYKIKQ